MTLLVRAALAALAMSLAGSWPTAASAGPPPIRYVAVSVATLWTSPTAPRAIDEPALGNPVNMRAWSARLSTSARRDLQGRVESQALYGEAVRVVAQRGAWSRVLIIDQPTPRDSRGYPGWVPTRQLAAAWPGFTRLLSGRIAVVAGTTAWLQAGRLRIELSFGTQLPLARVTSRSVLVTTPTAQSGWLSLSAVRIYSSRRAIPRPTGQAIVAAARGFLGVRYLWGGTSAFGFDCSGLVNLVYRTLGVVIPRDADAQARRGRSVSWSNLRPGDLVFYGRRHVHHVALYAGRGTMIEAPDSAGSVRLTSLRAGDFAGARRYLP